MVYVKKCVKCSPDSHGFFEIFFVNVCHFEFGVSNVFGEDVVVTKLIDLINLIDDTVR